VTLVIAVHGSNFVILGADSRGTIGTDDQGLIIGLDDRTKLIQVAPHVGFMLFGHGDVGDMLIDDFLPSCSGVDGISTVANNFRAHCRQKWNEWLTGVQPQTLPRFGFLISGLDKDQSGNFVVPRTRSLLSAYGFVPSYHRSKFVAMGIPMLANYLLKKKCKENNLTIETLAPIVAYTIHETAWVDRRVGGPVHIAIIDKSGYRTPSQNEIKEWIDDLQGSEESHVP
jgi:hypothetical protein